MKRPLLALLIVALIAPCSYARTRGETENSQWIRYYDTSKNETISVLAPWYFEDDFIGAYFQKYTANEDTHSLWKTVETNLNVAMDLLADGVPGIVSHALDSDNNAERAVNYFGNNECMSLYQGCAFEARVQWSVLGTGQTTSLVGVIGTDNADPDTIDVMACFKLDSGDSDALLWETDDGTTDDDDNTGQAIVVSTWYVLRIECWSTGAVYFFVDGVQVGKGAMAALTSTTGKVQPYLCIEKAGGTGVGTMLVDYVRCWGQR